MKLKSLVSTLGLASLLFTPISWANQATPIVKIVKISNWVGTQNSPKEALFVQTNEESVTNPAACTKKDGYYLEGASTVSRSMLLTAITTGSDVTLNIGSGGCAVDNRPVIVQVALHQ